MQQVKVQTLAVLPEQALSPIETRRYQKLKIQIRNWWDDRFKTGEALREIRDNKLYQREYDTFEEFCIEEFDLKHSQAYRLIEAANVKEGLKTSPMGDKITNERQARALAEAPPEKRVEVLETVVNTGPVTAKRIAQAVAETDQKPKDEAVLTDKIGRAIPEDLRAEWQRAETVGKRLRSLAREIKNTVEQGFSGAKQDKLKDPIYAEVGNTIIAEAGALAYTLDSIIPYVLCPTCSGRLSKNCTLCRQRGWISRFLWNSPAVNKETRELIGRHAAS
jgi:hypothetical protein